MKGVLIHRPVRSITIRILTVFVIGVITRDHKKAFGPAAFGPRVWLSRRQCQRAAGLEEDTQRCGAPAVKPAPLCTGSGEKPTGMPLGGWPYYSDISVLIFLFQNTVFFPVNNYPIC